MVRHFWKYEFKGVYRLRIRLSIRILKPFGFSVAMTQWPLAASIYIQWTISSGAILRHIPIDVLTPPRHHWSPSSRSTSSSCQATSWSRPARVSEAVTRLWSRPRVTSSSDLKSWDPERVQRTLFEINILKTNNISWNGDNFYTLYIIILTNGSIHPHTPPSLSGTEFCKYLRRISYPEDSRFIRSFRNAQWCMWEVWSMLTY